MTKRTWMVRAGQNGVHATEFLEGGYVSVGFGEEVGHLANGTTREELINRMQQFYPNRKRGKVVNAAGQLHRFYFEIQKGDRVITYDTSQRRYFVGTIQGDAQHIERGTSEPHRKQRDVRWEGRVSRDALSVSTRNTLGSTLTLFLLNDDAAKDVETNTVPLDAPDDVAAAEPPPSESGDAGLNTMLGDVVSKSNEFIEDLIAGLDPEQMEDLVAGILRGMGYKTRTSAKGPDRGVDIFASPDGLGLLEPRIFVEVKHRKASMGAPELRAFLGGRQSGDRCLFVSTGGFTKEALYEAERSSIPLTLIDLPSLRELLVEHYEALDTPTRALVPLRRLYWPVADDD